MFCLIVFYRRTFEAHRLKTTDVIQSYTHRLSIKFKVYVFNGYYLIPIDLVTLYHTKVYNRQLALSIILSITPLKIVYHRNRDKNSHLYHHEYWSWSIRSMCFINYIFSLLRVGITEKEILDLLYFKSCYLHWRGILLYDNMCKYFSYYNMYIYFRYKYVKLVVVYLLTV